MEVVNDLLNYDNIKIVQNSDWFSFSLDSVLLANFVHVNNKMRIMDFCCGNAPIPLILSTKTNSKITGVEIQKEVFSLAIKSVRLNNKEKQIEIDENIYSIFENELGRTLSPLEYEKIKEMVTSYGQELVVEALKEAVYNRANNLRYIETILSEWNKKGYKSKADILKDRENYRKKKTDNIKLPDIDWLNEDE